MSESTPTRLPASRPLEVFGFASSVTQLFRTSSGTTVLFLLVFRGIQVDQEERLKTTTNWLNCHQKDLWAVGQTPFPIRLSPAGRLMTETNRSSKDAT